MLSQRLELIAVICVASAAAARASNVTDQLTVARSQSTEGNPRAGTVSDTVLGYTPADYNANHAVLVAARTAVKAAAADLHAARGDAKTIANDLRGQGASKASTAPSTTTTTVAQ